MRLRGVYTHEEHETESSRGYLFQLPPVFTGKQKLIDSAGRVDKFKRRYEKKKEPKIKKGSSQEKSSVENKGLDGLDNIEGVDKG